MTSGGSRPHRGEGRHQSRLADSFEQALKLAEGLAYVDLADGVVPGREGEAKGKT
jgi:excinuclease ABC subunit A